MSFRIGNGYDVHQLKPGRPLILGGVTIDWSSGLEGHSDADVLLHALCDALLGAVGLGDIGRHFPPVDSQFKDMDSRKFVERTIALLAQDHWKVVNVDCTIVAEKPKLAPYIPQMEENIAIDLGVLSDRINVKATTTEKLGFCGREEGMAAWVTVLITQTNT